MGEKFINNQGLVGVLISLTYGHGWSTTESNPKIKEEMMMNKYLVNYILDCEKNNIKKSRTEVEKIWKEKFPIHPLPEMRGVEKLCVMWIKPGAAFKILQVKGAEYLYQPSDDPEWIIA